ncbi:VC0807 family protein [Chitinimonas viridis]|uniref:VC0807 family protein n=2 Tax=Chitinimonas TaxID=240411 RepID=A0ABT8B1Y2_9NEIS|nr:VC0807 family protein [Chitinimonas viridis]MDN3576233.1 VC0807 family protein [Chitinimonas viridis]
MAHSPIDSVPPTAAPAPNKPSLMGNLLMNIIIPTVIMTQLNDENRLGPVWSMLVALMFPLGYGIREYLTSRKTNFISILGLISIMLTGGMALLKLPPEYIAIKEAAIPTLLGLLTVISIKTPYPLVRTFLYNEQVLQVDKIAAALKQYGNERRFDQVLTNSSWLIASSFLLSGVLNYVLAKWIVVSQPGTPAFTAELGRMTLLSYPVIVLPSTLVLAATLYYLISNIEKLTHMAMADIMQAT